MKLHRFALPILTILALGACSPPTSVQDGPTAASTGAPPASAAPTARSLPTGPYKLTTASGAEITFTLPTPASDPAVAELEAYRVKTGGPPVSYLVADVDNRKGIVPVNMYMVSAYDEEGRQFTFTTVTDSIDKWTPSLGTDGHWKGPNGKALPEEVGDDLQRAGVDLYNANIDDAAIAERTTIILASTDTDLPGTFTRVAVLPSGGMGQEEEAEPAA